ncbi:uncharacterized protein LOC117317725 [Pecten maximus]|uniref:uncharacterized protein LOC117317725 n=1 Tax=Pecten maximus TaxID=6579 RepID=UPI001458E75A|nr:uncharacterized protein LOC117317725 [Pecten maximus]
MATQKSRKHVVVFTSGGTDRCILCLLALVLMCHDTDQYTLGTMTSWTIGQTIIGNSIRTIQVRTKHECALHCVVDISCQAVAVYCKSSQQTGSFDCELNYASYIIANNSDMCYSLVQSRDEFVNGVNVQDLSTTTVPLAVTTAAAPTTVIASVSSPTATSQVRGGIGNLINMCSSSSAIDIALIMDDGVYIYDDLPSLETGACAGPLALSTVFSGYSGAKSLPAISNIICLMVHQNNEIDMFDSKYLKRHLLKSFWTAIQIFSYQNYS